MIQILLSAGLALFAQPADSVRLDLEGTVLTAEKRTGALAASSAASARLELDRLESAPRIFGSADPLRLAQSLPGVSTNSEIDGGIHILGCESEHNIVRIGAAPIYGSNHLFGLFSPFIPSHFSTMEISTDAPLRNRLGGEVFLDTPDTARTGRPWLSADAGLFFSQGTVDVPLSARSSLRLSGRVSYLNAMYGNYLKIGGNDLDYGFTDANLTWTFRKDKYRIRKTDVYFGSDKAAIDAQGYGIPLSFGWRNMALSQRFINTRFGEQALYFSQYDATVNPGDGGGFHPVGHLLRTIGYRSQVNAFRSERGRAVLGFEGAFHQFVPIGEDIRMPSLEASLFQSWNRHWGDFTLDVKLSETLYYYFRDACLDVSPALGISYDFHRFGRLALNAGRKVQHITRTGVSEIGFPTEFFMCSNSALPPQYADYVTLDYKADFGAGRYSFSTQAYLKRLEGQPVFTGSLFDYFSEDFWPFDHMVFTDGLNYGLTMLLTRNSGKLTGWAAYSFGRALRSGSIPSSHERIHELNLVLNYEGGKWDCGASFVLAGGTPFTAPRGFFIASGMLVSNYGEINSSRLPAYSRLDLSFNWYFLRDSGRTFGANVSVYNALCHDNVLSYRPDIADDSFVYRPLSFSLKFMPSLSVFYRFR